MSKVAIMQGRLGPPEDGRFQSFPLTRWREEFPAAASAGLDAIEWIYDEYGRTGNPITSEAGLHEIHVLSEKHNVAVVSLCADYFMDHPIVRASEEGRARLVDHFDWLISSCSKVGISRIVIPFVDQSRISGQQDETIVVDYVSSILPVAERYGIELHLETDLAPALFAALLRRLPNKWVKVNYDSGNSSSLGYKPEEEFRAYGDRIGSVHIKDRLFGGGTVPLGEGDADLPSVIRGLRELGYAGDYVLLVARGESGSEVEWTKHNIAYLSDLLQSPERTV